MSVGSDGIQTRPLTAAGNPWREDALMTDGLELPDHEQRMGQARRRSLWELGDPSWAGVIVNAYRFPGLDAANLQEEQGADQ